MLVAFPYHQPHVCHHVPNVRWVLLDDYGDIRGETLYPCYNFRDLPLLWVDRLAGSGGEGGYIASLTMLGCLAAVRGAPRILSFGCASLAWEGLGQSC